MKAKLKAIGKGIVAAVTSPEAVKHERSIAALVATRVLLAVGATDALVKLISSIIGG